MRKLGNTLYVTLPDVYLSLDGENIVVLQDGKEVRRIPLHNLESILVFGYTGASPALMGACARRGIALSFFTPSGRFLSRVTGEGHGNVVLRKTQYRISDDEQQSLGIARSFLFGKLHNSRWVLERAMRDHPMRLDATKVDRASGFLKNALEQLSQAQNLEQLRGVEGEAASRYFSVFDELILQQKDSFSFSSRSRRPPLDRVNALLSFTYSLLAHDVSSALESVGLDPYVGVLPRDRPGRTSLSLDLMEEFRSVIADRFVLSIINKKQVKATGFTEKENGAILMDDDTRRSVLNAWQLRKQEMLTHPFLEEKISWGLVPYIQAMLLARYLRGDLDGYPPFFWK